MIKDSALASAQLHREHWHKSSYSGTAGNCIEVTDLGRGVRAVRDSKDPTGPALTFTAAEWSAFTAGLCAGELE
jgi:hypothetical protein